jgi:hypothetical protein
VIAVVVTAWPTSWSAGEEAEPVKLVSPAYVAVRVCEPEVVNVSGHWPVATLAVHEMAPSLTVTMPVGVPDPGEFTDTENEIATD